MTDRVFRTLSARPAGGLDHESLPMRLELAELAMAQLQRRLRRIEIARDRGIDAVLVELETGGEAGAPSE